MGGPTGSTYPPVRVVAGPAFELVAELGAFACGPARPALESGRQWVRKVRALAGPDLTRRVAAWSFPLYAELAPIALEGGPPYDAHSLANRLRAMPAATLRRRLLGGESRLNRDMVSEGAFDRAIDGDPRARAELRRALALDPPARAGLDGLLETPATEVRAEIAAIVEAWSERVSPAFAERSMALIEQDVEPKEGLLQSTRPKDALRVFTNGVDIDPPDWTTEIAVVPTVAMRPFMTPVDWRSTLMILCSIADETLDEGAGGPPRRLVLVAAALADEQRLRILRALGEDALTPGQLARLLGVEPASLHHHLAILRSAGLVRVTAEGGNAWRYELRRHGLERATEVLEIYLGPRSAQRGRDLDDVWAASAKIGLRWPR